MKELKPEVKAEIILWDWMLNNNPDGNIEIIYFNRKNTLNCKTFRVEGDMKIPDFILKIKDKYKIKYYAVEVKSSDKSRNILQSSKILDLYKKESWRNNADKEGNMSKYLAATKYGIIPKKEGNRTYEFIRMIWNEYGKFRNNYDKKLDVGIIIGNQEEDNKPFMMITSHNGKRWGQRWLRL